MNVSPSRKYALSILIRFCIYFALTAAAVLAVVSYIEYREFRFQRAKAQDQESLRLSLAAKTIAEDLRVLYSNILTLSHSDILLDYLEDPSEPNRVRLEKQYRQLATYEQLYDQIRYIDSSGMERVRVNFSRGSVAAVPASNLQDKSDRYYFHEAIQLNPNYVFISPMDLNVEHGAIEQPFKPMIRVATPVFDRLGNRKGVIVLNYLASIILERFEETMLGSWGNPMLLNPDGYWLFSSDKNKEWGFMLGLDSTFSKTYAEAWRYIRAQNSGVVQTRQGTFSFNTVYPFPWDTSSSRKPTTLGTDSYFWKIVTRTPPDQIAFSLSKGLQGRSGALAALLTIVGLLSFLLAWLRTNSLRDAFALRQRTDQVHDLYNNAPCGYHSLAEDGTFIEINNTELKWLGYGRDEIVDKVKFPDLLTEDSRKTFDENFPVFKARGWIQDLEFEMVRKDGSILPVSLSASAVTNGTKRYVMSRSTIFDITERKRTEKKLRQAAVVFESTNQGVIITDTNQNIIAVNRAFTEISGYAPEEVLGKNPKLQKSGQQDDEFYRKLWAALDESGQWQGQIINRRKNGEIYPAWENISVVTDDKGRVVNYISVLSDITSIKQAEERLARLAHHDALTGLPNRLLFQANLNQALTRAKRHKRRVALLFLDLDRFKLINDSLGHAAGDRLLQVVANRLRHCVRAEDTVSRLGGDEFTVVLDEIAHPEDAALLAEKIIAAVSEPTAIGDREVVTSTSIGIALYPDDAENGEDLARAADAAMYQAKQYGRNTYQYYTPALTAMALEHLALENSLRQALEREEFVLYYQPQIELSTGRIVGVEALIRWQHPEWGLVLPAKFIPVAEETGLIEPIGEWVLRTACIQAKAWRAAGMPPTRMSVNLSGRQVLKQTAMDRLWQVVEASGLQRGELQLDLEITENLIQLVERSLNTLNHFKTLGVMLAIDDFGTGYSSLSHLKRLPIDALKIDRSFVQEIPTDPDDQAIAGAIVAMGHSMRLKVIAEGVETDEQLQFLKTQGCDEVQGFLFGEPVPADTIEQRLSNTP